MAVWKKVEELEIGDHVYRPTEVRVGGKRIGGNDVFLYCHHGIVAEVEGEKMVIAFGRKPPPSGATESYAGRKVRQAAIKAMSVLVSLKFGAEVKTETLESFTYEGRVHIYQYGVEEGALTFVDGSSPASEVNKGEAAAEIAKLFVDEDVETEEPFGTYDLGKWNCECFASFCKTTRIDKDLLRSELEKLGPGEGLPREFLKKDGEAKTWQIERFIKKGWARKKQKGAQTFAGSESTHAAVSAVAEGTDGVQYEDPHNDVEVLVDIDEGVDDEV